MIRNIIFDWSGTLVDDLPAVWRATNFVFSQAGIAALTLEEFRAEFCLPFTRFYERYTPQVPQAQLEGWFMQRGIIATASCSRRRRRTRWPTRSSPPEGARPQSEGLENVGATTDATIQIDLTTPGHSIDNL